MSVHLTPTPHTPGDLCVRLGCADAVVEASCPEGGIVPESPPKSIQNGVIVAGVGPDARILEDATGYRSSESPYRMDLMPPAALLHLAAIMCAGAKTHGESNWKRGSVEKHLNKMLAHTLAYLAGDTSDDHLGHAAWRAMAALEIHLSGPSTSATN